LYCGDKLVQEITGYTTYENQEIKKIQRHHYRTVPAGELLVPTEPFRAAIRQEMEGKDPWMMKTGIEFYKAYEFLKPYNIFVIRDPAGVADSLVAKRPNLDRDLAFEVAKKRNKLIHFCMKHFNNGVILQQWCDR
jgi:hypothetical protein